MPPSAGRSAQPYGAGCGVEAGALSGEKPLDQSAAHHFVAGEVVQVGCVDQGDSVAEREGDVEIVGREEDALALVVGQPAEECRQFVAVRQVEERRGFVEQDDRCLLYTSDAADD